MRNRFGRPMAHCLTGVVVGVGARCAPKHRCVAGRARWHRQRKAPKHCQRSSPKPVPAHPVSDELAAMVVGRACCSCGAQPAAR
eukprot:1070216-Alexandrium_andersonii.AAC.1